MFDIGFWEISLIFVVGLLILGPERMPQVARTAGLFLGRARAAMRKLQREVQRELLVEETRAAVDEARKLYDDHVAPTIDPGHGSVSGKPEEPGVEPDTDSGRTVAPGVGADTGSDETVAPGIGPEQRNDNTAS